MSDLNVSFIGAGRVASALARKMNDSGYRICRIVSPGETRGKALAAACNAEWSAVADFTAATDIIIVSVPDRVLNEVLKGISCPGTTIVVHTAGSYGLEVFPGHIKTKGVFYPLQTFSENRQVEFSGLPFLLEASDGQILSQLDKLGVSIGGSIYHAGADKRAMIHAAAVFICNFTNHMLTEGKMVADHSDIPFEIFSPLIKETIEKALVSGPENSQTGPAARNDMNTIEKHLELLSFSPDLQKIYREVSASIIKYYNRS
jgi:predicted short-subunit dehydrogenase-like oxidoreductase (DUF2520 family)